MKAYYNTLVPAFRIVQRGVNFFVQQQMHLQGLREIDSWEDVSPPQETFEQAHGTFGVKSGVFVRPEVPSALPA